MLKTEINNYSSSGFNAENVNFNFKVLKTVMYFLPLGPILR